MNDCKFSGRPTKDPEIRYTSDPTPLPVARYTLAVDRKYKKDGQKSADFLTIKAFGKNAEFVERYIKKGVKIIVECEAQSGYYDKDGQRIYYTEFIAHNHEFCESRSNTELPEPAPNDFIQIPEGVEKELPFH